PEDSGEILAGHLIKLMRATQMPNGLSGIGYRAQDIEPLTAGAWLQQRLLKNAPRAISRDDLKTLFGKATAYW
ncbi:MAG: alcohol dehydrogenase, partial [Pseudomonadota bacterium]|nr:alcohol dehydrogenase [Pseudomonadota bacterium]